MAKFEIEVDDCSSCPCLRNNQYGDFYCFYKDYMEMQLFDLGIIHPGCPLRKGTNYDIKQTQELDSIKKSNKFKLVQEFYEEKKNEKG